MVPHLVSVSLYENMCRISSLVYIIRLHTGPRGGDDTLHVYPIDRESVFKVSAFLHDYCNAFSVFSPVTGSKNPCAPSSVKSCLRELYNPDPCHEYICQKKISYLMTASLDAMLHLIAWYREGSDVHRQGDTVYCGCRWLRDASITLHTTAMYPWEKMG